MCGEPPLPLLTPPYAASNLVGIYGTISMLPMALLAMGTLAWVVFAAKERRVRIAAAVGGAIVALVIAPPLLLDPRPSAAPVEEARAFITREWTPSGHDLASHAEVELREHPTAEGYARQAELYAAEGRRNEARTAEARAARHARP